VVTHRVVEVVSGGTHPVIRTKGDANAAPDPWDARLGDGPVWRMRGMVPGAGQAMAVARSPLVHRITVLAAPLAFALFVVIGIWKDDSDT
jgi:signal peptidase